MKKYLILIIGTLLLIGCIEYKPVSGKFVKYSVKGDNKIYCFKDTLNVDLYLSNEIVATYFIRYKTWDGDIKDIKVDSTTYSKVQIGQKIRKW